MSPRPRRPDRPARRRMPLLLGGGAVAAAGAALVLTGGASTVSGAPRLGHDDPVARRIDAQAIALINRASSRTIKLRSSCRPSFPRGHAVIVDGGAGPQVTALLGVFRRAPTAADRAASAALLAHPPGNPFFAEVPRDGVRVVTAGDGTRVMLVAATKLRAIGLTSAKRASCRLVTRRELVRIAAGARPVIRRAALREFDASARRERAATPTPDTEGLEVHAGHGSGGAGFSTKQFVDQPVRFGSISRKRAHLILVVPDGVARVELRFPRYSSRGPHRAPLDHRRAQRAAGRVVDNVASVMVSGRGIGGAFGATVVEYAADGTIVRTVRSPE
jgi:hypothetical protein